MKNEKIKKKYTNIDVYTFCKHKIEKYQDIIEKTTLIIHKYKRLNILGASELNACIQSL